MIRSLSVIAVVGCLAVAPPALAQRAPSIVGDAAHWRLVLPIAYQRALDRIAPGMAAFRDERYFERRRRDSPLSPSVVIGDINGDGKADVVLYGSLGDSVAVVALHSSVHGVVGLVLYQAAWRSPRQSYVRERLSLLEEGGHTWIRWQDIDCKEEGLDFRLVARGFVKRKSPCSYGN